MDNSEQKMMDSGNSGSLVVESDQNNLEVILDIPLEITIELGRTRMVVNDLLKLAQGSVIELSKMAGETLEILANQRLVAKGEVVAVNDKYGVRLTEIVTPMERLESLK
ncbi:MAG: flagellar motor switch protein FliN [Deltaproteobacteria bacterium]|nr:flagellar motor switch protein FliN [Deltaproteobacteria bacterium]